MNALKKYLAVAALAAFALSFSSCEKCQECDNNGTITECCGTGATCDTHTVACEASGGVITEK